ncbi:MAG: hypothetical protein Q9187_008361, partial [Circinaria calcarea]
NAYGVCVILVTFLTTCLVALVALIIWRLNPILVLFGWLVFATLDGAYLSSALTKVPTGAWFTLVLAGLLSCIFILWRFGKEQQWLAEAEDRFRPSHLVTQGENGQLQLTPTFGGGSLTGLRGFAIFFDKAGDMTPTVFIQFLSKFVAIPEVVVFFHLRPLHMPSCPVERRYTVTRTVIPNCYRLVIRHGYTDEVFTENVSRLVYEEIRKFIISDQSTPRKSPLIVSEKSTESDPAGSSSSSTEDGNIEIDPTAVRLAELQKAYDKQVLYIVGKEQMRIREGTKIGRRMLLNAFLWLRENTRSKIASLKVPTDKLVEVGFIKEI